MISCPFQLRNVKLEVHKSNAGSYIFSSLEKDALVKSSLNGSSLRDKSKDLLKRIITCDGVFKFLIQFWTVKTINSRSCLIATEEPFVFGRLCKGLCIYREHCMDHQYLVDDVAKEDELGPPGRVFLTNLPEFTQDLRLYSTKEFPLRNYAIPLCLRMYGAIPISMYPNQCEGVLEFVGYENRDYDKILKYLKPLLEGQALISTHLQVYQSEHVIPQSAEHEISNMLEFVPEIPQICQVDVWVSCNQCSSEGCMQLAMSTGVMSLWKCKCHRARKGKGILGILLASESKSCFCPNLCHFNITEEPGKHLAQYHRLGACFAICLQSSYTGNDFYMIEFFLGHGSSTKEKLSSFLNFLLSIMKKELKSFKVASGRELGEELVVEVIMFDKSSEFGSIDPNDHNRFPLKFKLLQYGEENSRPLCEYGTMHNNCPDLNSRREDVEVEQETMTSVGLNEEDSVPLITSKGRQRKMSIDITLDDLNPHFGKKLEDVAKELGVCRSTIKRVCRENGINRWPSHPNNKNCLSGFGRTMANNSVKNSKKQKLSACINEQQDFSLNQNNLYGNATEGNQSLIQPEEVSYVVINATYDNDTVKFQLSHSSPLEKLEEEVIKRFKLEATSFKLKYMDEDGQWILLACDDDLHFGMKTLKALGKTRVQVLVQPI